MAAGDCCFTRVGVSFSQGCDDLIPAVCRMDTAFAHSHTQTTLVFVDNCPPPPTLFEPLKAIRA